MVANACGRRTEGQVSSGSSFSVFLLTEQSQNSFDLNTRKVDNSVSQEQLDETITLGPGCIGDRNQRIRAAYRQVVQVQQGLRIRALFK